ncbi:hypothetical protein Tsubulata_031432 [Turnera subulata]|uniref:Uncharacterized protein n=1 Tax=Turnera subulata TaxID=218843 RepID=A0A9Q0G9S7_9ROSI|nr:hypothetical protein Tsubulata_031432 [Turnera subulata]
MAGLLALGLWLEQKEQEERQARRLRCQRVIEMHEEGLMRNKPYCFSRTLDWLAERKCSEFQMELMSLSKVYASTQSYPRRECRSLRKKYDDSSGLPDVRNASVAKMSDLKCHGFELLMTLF